MSGTRLFDNKVRSFHHEHDRHAPSVGFFSRQDRCSLLTRRILLSLPDRFLRALSPGLGDEFCFPVDPPPILGKGILQLSLVDVSSPPVTRFHRHGE